MSSTDRFASLFIAAALAVWSPVARAQSVVTPDSSRLPNLSPPRETPAAPVEPLGSGADITSDLVPGELAPSFELQNADGAWVRLGDLRGQWVALVFANTRASLAPLRRIENDLSSMGVRLEAITPDDPRALRALARREAIGFELLSDPTGEISRLYGMADPGQTGIQPGLVLVAPNGVARAAQHVAALDPDAILDAVRQNLLGPAAYRP